jgi:hypothetical protein
LPSKTEKEITHQEKTLGIKKEVVSFSSFGQLYNEPDVLLRSDKMAAVAMITM